MKTTKQFKKEVFDLVNDEYTVLGEYKNNKTKILIRHNCKECNNYEWEITPNRFLSQNNRCPYCFGSFKKTTKQFKKEVFDLVNDEYTVLGEYVNNKTKTLIRHNCKECNNYEWEIQPKDFLKGQRCPYCYNKKGRSSNRKLTNNEFLLIFKDKFKDKSNDYEIMDEYKGSMIKIRVNYKKCNHKPWYARPDEFLSGISHCPECSRGNHRSKGEKELAEFIEGL